MFKSIIHFTCRVLDTINSQQRTCTPTSRIQAFLGHDKFKIYLVHPLFLPAILHPNPDKMETEVETEVNKRATKIDIKSISETPNLSSVSTH